MTLRTDPIDWDDVDDTTDLPDKFADVSDEEFFQSAETLREDLLLRGLEEGLTFEEKIQSGGVQRNAYWGWEFVVRTPGAEMAASIELLAREDEKSYRVSVYIPRNGKIRIYSTEDTCEDPALAADLALSSLMELVCDAEDIERTHRQFSRPAPEEARPEEELPGTRS